MTGFHGFLRAPCSAATLWAWRAWVWRAWGWGGPCSRRPRRRRGGKEGGVLKIASPANLSSLDPAVGGAGSDHAILWTMYDTLVEWDYATLQPQPAIAEWIFPDPKTMLLRLKPGISFHDGTPCDAEAVRWNIERNRGDVA